VFNILSLFYYEFRRNLRGFFFNEDFFSVIFLVFLNSEVFFSGDFFFDFLLFLLNVSVHEEIGEFIELSFLEFSLKGKNFSGEEPVDHGKRLLGSVIARNGAVDIRQVVVGVAKGNDGDVNIGALHKGVVIDSGVGEDEKSGLNEFFGVLIGEHTGSPSSGDAAALGIFREFVHGSLSIESSGNSNDGAGVGDGSNNSSSSLDLLVLLLDIEHVNTAGLFVPDVFGHLLGAVLST
jgi:hypothetical protein